MFCVIYELKVKAAEEALFRQAWHAVTQEMITRCGSLGARLHRSDEGTFIAYAQWPNRESWKAGHLVIDEETHRLHLEKCLDGNPVILRELVLLDDLLKV